MDIYFLLIFCIFIDALLLIIYFNKERVRLFENRMYVALIICNIVCLILEIISNLIAMQYIHIDSEPVVRMFLFGLLQWGGILTIYDIIIFVKNESKYKLISLACLAVFFIFSLPLFFLNIEFVIQGSSYFASGEAIEYLVAIAFVFVVLNLVMIIINRKKIGKKIIPIITYMALMFLVLIVHNIDPTIPAINCFETFICMLMYFTIENPDVKLVEYEKAEKERAEAASLAKSEFLSSMSHELRTPLNAIVGLSEDIESYMEEVPEEVKEDTKDIINASNTLLELIGSILDISKIESGKLDIIDSDYDPKEEFESLAKIMRTKFNEKRLEFKVSLADNIPEVLFGDRLRIKQIINNLLSNACKYTDNGNVLFQVNWLAASGSLQIIVKDTGRGVKPEDIDKLFAKYDRLGVEKTSSVQGTGLGLPITKTLIDLMGGTITVDSTYLVGTTFTVILPQKFGSKERLEELRRENESAPSRTDYSGMKLLVVDDNMLNIKVLKKAIKSLNFEVDECYNGKEALDKIEVNNNYDIVLLDILMPVMNGEETIKNLRLKPNFKTPVIALTADAMTGAKEKYQAMGFDDYIAKPFTRDAIAKKLASVLGDEKKDPQYEVNTEVQPDIKTNTQPVANTEVKTEVNEETK